MNRKTDLYSRIEAENKKMKQVGWRNSMSLWIELPDGKCEIRQTEGCGHCKHYSDYVHPYERLCGSPTMTTSMHECLKHRFRTWENCCCLDYEKKPDNVEVAETGSGVAFEATTFWALLLIGMILITIVIAYLF